MSVTAKGKRWETLHSLWIGWTLTFGLFNWIAFIYIGFRFVVVVEDILQGDPA